MLVVFELCPGQLCLEMSAKRCGGGSKVTILAEITSDFSFLFIHSRCPLPARQLEPSQGPTKVKQTRGGADVQPVRVEDHRAVSTCHTCGQHRWTQWVPGCWECLDCFPQSKAKLSALPGSAEERWGGCAVLEMLGRFSCVHAPLLVQKLKL